MAKAKPGPSPIPPHRLANRRVVIAATGPSLSPAQVAAVTSAKRRNPHSLAVVAVNDAYKLFPDADILYACDSAWWRVHKGAPGFRGERWNQIFLKGATERHDLAAAAQWGLQSVASKNAPRPFLAGNTIAQGMNSGFQAVNLAVLMGAREIVLIGFDMSRGGQTHFFGDHPRPLANDSPYTLFLKAFDRAAPAYAAAGVRIINASARTAMTCFPRLDLERALA